MGTNNKAVTAYLPPEIETRLSEYCLEHGISRQGKKSGKEKPALGTGIIEVLKIFFEAESNHDISVVDKQVLQEIVTETLSSTVPTREWVKTEIQQAIAAVKTELDSQPAKGSTASQPLSSEVSSLTLQQSDLARRLKTNPSTLSRHHKKGEQHFAQWTKARDPEKLAWQFLEIRDNSKLFETRI